MAANPLTHVERPAAGAPRGALVFFHGVYGKSEDFLPFMDKLDPERHLHAYLPQGVHLIDEGRSSWVDPETEEPTGDLPAVLAWLDALPFPSRRQIVGGWSQGASIAYGVAFAAGRRHPAGLLALGGWIWEEVESDFLPPCPKTLIAHGRLDDAVPVEEARAARDRLEQHGVSVSYLEPEIGHTIDPGVVPHLRSFIASVSADFRE
jgi:phospholipase/carboxylesterase